MTLLFAFLIGFLGGLRSLTAPAATAWAVYLGWLKLERPLSLIGSIPSVAIFTLLAVVELVADKLPQTPSRTAPPGLIARIVMWVDRRMRRRERSAGNFSWRRVRSRRWRRRLFPRLPGAYGARESAGCARLLYRPG